MAATLVGATAAHAATTVNISTNIPYYSSNGVAQVLDSYVPSDAKPGSPAVIYVHGGGWAAGDKSRWGDWPQKTAANMGYPTFNINYVLNSPNPSWEQYVDVANAIAWVKAHAATYRIDPNRIAVIGESAGGQLAELAGTFPASAQYRPKVVISLSGISDLPLLASDAGCQTVACTLTTTLTQTLAAMVQNNLTKVSYAASPQTWINASPVTYVDASDTPMFLINSTNELTPLDQLTSLQNALTAHGVAVNTLRLPGTQHAVDYMPTAAWPIMQYLSSHL